MEPVCPDCGGSVMTTPNYHHWICREHGIVIPVEQLEKDAWVYNEKDWVYNEKEMVCNKYKY